MQRTVLDRAIEAAREHLRMKDDPTLEQVGKLAGGLRQPSISEWRGGGPKLKNAIIFANATNICVEWLYTERGPKHPIPPDDDLIARLISLWGSVSDVNKGRIMQIAEDDAGRQTAFRKAL